MKKFIVFLFGAIFLLTSILYTYISGAGKKRGLRNTDIHGYMIRDR